MTPGNARRLLLQCNMLYCASQQERKPERMTRLSTALAITAVVLGCALGAIPAAAEETKPPIQIGAASWYGPGFHGKRTANGEKFDTNALTAAHKTLPFGTQLRVTNERTGKSVVVRINDRGPYAHGRVIDLSKAAAEAVGISGVGQVTLAAL
jgi:rare lipoprotein A